LSWTRFRLKRWIGLSAWHALQPVARRLRRRIRNWRPPIVANGISEPRQGASVRNPGVAPR
jgi:hypothetical protein